MVKDLVTIIIPTYNRRNTIRDALECAVSQTYKAIEIIVVDNHSMDGTYEFLATQYENNSVVKLHRNDANLGPVKNWEKCFGYANGEFCKILWSDDLMEPDFIEKSVKILKENADVAFVYSKVALTQVGAIRNYGTIAYSLGKTGKYAKDLFLEKMCKLDGSVPVSPGCALFRSRDIKIIKNIPNNFGIDYLSTGAGPDVLIYLFATVHYDYIYYIDEVLNFFRMHTSSISCSGIDLSYSYLTALMYFVSKIKPNRKYRRMLLEDIITHGIHENKEWKEIYRDLKKCNKTATIVGFLFAYQKAMRRFLND